MLEFHTQDVFTTTPFGGNPLAVVMDADGLSTAQMQTIAREFNLSETLFVQTPDDPSHTAKVRIFFPTAEIPFAGHPTIGCAILLAEMAHSGDFDCTITLEEVAGLVPVRVIRQGFDITAEFKAPLLPIKGNGMPPDADMVAKSLGLGPADIGFDNHHPLHWQAGPDFMYIPLASPQALSLAKPAAGWRAMIEATGAEAYYLYCRSAAGFSTRMYAPDHGIAEDPATGSASAIFAAQLLSAGELSSGDNRVALLQGEDMGRPSQISLRANVTGGAITAILIKGTAVRISSGEISIPEITSIGEQ